MKTIPLRMLRYLRDSFAANSTNPAGMDSLRTFCADRRGNVILMFAIMLVPLLGILGIAVDVSRGYLVKSRLGDALDSAALAAAQSVDDTVEFSEDVSKFFYANYPDGFLGSEVTVATPVVSADKETITLAATATVGATILNVLGVNSIDVSASTEVTRRVAGIDVAISLDMSGSMVNNTDGDSVTRLAEAKDAALLLVGILFGDGVTENENLNVGLVPWSSKVNVLYEVTSGVPVPGSYSSSNGFWYADNSPVPLRSMPDPDWQGCVYARYTDDGVSNDADHLLGPTMVGATDWRGWDWIGADGEPPVGEDPDDCHTPGGFSNGHNWRCPCINHGITRLTHQRSAIEGAINRLSHAEGSTVISQGLSWAWRVVSPGDPFDDAEANPNGLHKRAIVILTDGEAQDVVGGSYDGVFGIAWEAEDGVNERVEAVAQEIKDGGIDIYVVEYHEETTLMKNVATSNTAPYYFHTDNVDELNDAFEAIGDHLSELRLSR